MLKITEKKVSEIKNPIFIKKESLLYVLTGHLIKKEDCLPRLFGECLLCKTAIEASERRKYCQGSSELL